MSFFSRKRLETTRLYDKWILWRTATAVIGYSNGLQQSACARHTAQGYYAAQQQPQGSTYGYVNYPANQAADGGSHLNMEA